MLLRLLFVLEEASVLLPSLGTQVYPQDKEWVKGRNCWLAGQVDVRLTAHTLEVLHRLDAYAEIESHATAHAR